MTTWLASAVARLLRAPQLRDRLLQRAARRGRGLVLLWHRLAADDAPLPAADLRVVPTVPVSLFRAQLEALQSIADIVPLDTLQTHTTSTRLRVALTFDDDEPSHLQLAAPILADCSLPATFFLCGRALHDLRPPWWILLEAAIQRDGLQAVNTALGVQAHSAEALAAACEGTPLVHRIAERFHVRDLDAAALQLTGEQLAALVRAPGVTTGFHTVDHPVLPRCDDAALERALTHGRTTLAQLAGTPITRMAYPHGKVDARVRAAVAHHDFRAAYASGQRATSPDADALQIARWEPGALAPDLLLAHAAMRVSLPHTLADHAS